ncbi:hypothetical protein QQY24_15620 [Streptomyces sp. TG1A-8]|uniref:hypothetical protein n=1 Tax=Streptomyces sp. TG1A-8 TaxID=3051385 RepID=UPI00265B9232|nr:hypothetical protein [Streptomyces sp. TG1A-8]MDO0926775.1 hypothetical protein [Streptomyces sp. TG1A-8]
MRKHFKANDEPGRRKQVPAFGVCEGSGKPFTTFGAEPAVESEPCGQKLLRFSGEFVYCTKPKGHDKAHASV